MNLENTIKRASKILKNNNIYSYELDAEILLSEILGIKREKLITNNQINISKKNIKKFDTAIERRAKSEPIVLYSQIQPFEFFFCCFVTVFSFLCRFVIFTCNLF